MSEEDIKPKRKVEISFGPANDKQDPVEWAKANPKKTAAAAGLGYLLYKFFAFWTAPADKGAEVSRCKYCGSDNYGNGCPHSPDGRHMH